MSEQSTSQLQATVNVEFRIAPLHAYTYMTSGEFLTWTLSRIRILDNNLGIMHLHRSGAVIGPYRTFVAALELTACYKSADR